MYLYDLFDVWVGSIMVHQFFGWMFSEQLSTALGADPEASLYSPRGSEYTPGSQAASFGFWACSLLE